MKLTSYWIYFSLNEEQIDPRRWLQYVRARSDPHQRSLQQSRSFVNIAFEFHSITFFFNRQTSVDRRLIQQHFEILLFLRVIHSYIHHIMKLVAAIIVSMTSLLLQTSTGSAFVSVPQPPHCVVTKTPSCHRNNKKNGFQLRAFFEKELGAQPPLGFFDPLGLVADGDADKFDRYRYCEIKHGRIAMLAILGYIVQETGTRLPGT
jgi:hypothetical protein